MTQGEPRRTAESVEEMARRLEEEHRLMDEEDLHRELVEQARRRSLLRRQPDVSAELLRKSELEERILRHELARRRSKDERVIARSRGRAAVGLVFVVLGVLLTAAGLFLTAYLGWLAEH